MNPILTAAIIINIIIFVFVTVYIFILINNLNTKAHNLLHAKFVSIILLFAVYGSLLLFSFSFISLANNFNLDINSALEGDNLFKTQNLKKPGSTTSQPSSNQTDNF